MTILNLWVTPERAVVATDTVGLMPGGVRREISKMFPILHCNALIAGRGHIDITLAVLQQLVTIPGDFDGMAERTPETIERTIVNMRTYAKTQGIAMEIGYQSTILVGWSEKVNGMACTLFDYHPGKGVEVKEKKHFFAPGMDLDADAQESQNQLALMATPTGMEQLARRQIAWAAKTGQSQHFGGRLLIAELTKERVTVQASTALDQL